MNAIPRFIVRSFSATLSLAAAAGATGGVAWFAHVGGFPAGALMALVLKRPKRARPRPHDPVLGE